MKNIYWALVLLLLVSCGENDDYPKSYSTPSFQEGDLKAYTNQGEWNGGDSLQLFIDNSIKQLTQDLNFSIEWDNDQKMISDFPDKIEITSDNRAKFSKDGKTKNIGIRRKNGILYFHDLDTLQGFGIMNENERLALEIISFDHKIAPLSTGISSTYKYFETNFAFEKDGDLHFPILKFIEKRYTDNHLNGIGSQIIHNRINQDYLKTFQDPNRPYKDTLVYMESSIVYQN